ncbi:hypothetical protein [Eisenbergiella sp.]
MKTLKKLFLLGMAVLMITVSLAGCGQPNTVEGLVVSNEQFTEKEDIEGATQTEQVSAGEDVYASVYFIESPKGMEYTGKWYINGEEVKSDPQETTTDMSGAIVYQLEADSVKEGTLKFEVVYSDEVLSSKELTIK